MKTSINEIAKLLDIDCHVTNDVTLDTIRSVKSADKSSLAFFTKPKCNDEVAESKAACLILTPEAKENYTGSAQILTHPNPRLAIAKLIAHFYTPTPPEKTIHASATIDKSASVHPTAHIGPNVVIGPNVEIKEHAIIQAGCVLEKDINIGAYTHIYPNVSIYASSDIANNVIIHSGSVIGGDGFGFEKSENGWKKIAHIGGLVIKEHVEIGANVTIDRGTIDNTLIQEGTKLDNLVHIAHNVQVGKRCLICAYSGIAGSSTIGDDCTIAGRVTISDHITIPSGCTIGICTDVLKSIKSKGVYASPKNVCLPLVTANRLEVIMKQLPKLWSSIKGMVSTCTT